MTLIAKLQYDQIVILWAWFIVDSRKYIYDYDTSTRNESEK